MNYEVYYRTRWLREFVFCGNFPTFELASEHVDYLQNNLPNGKKITFEIIK